MRRKKAGLQRLAGFFDIPEDLVLDMPRITMLGNRQVLIENHKGIVEYTPSLVRVRLNQGELSVNGTELSLGSFQEEQILIEGLVASLHYDG